MVGFGVPIWVFNVIWYLFRQCPCTNDVDLDVCEFFSGVGTIFRNAKAAGFRSAQYDVLVHEVAQNIMTPGGICEVITIHPPLAAERSRPLGHRLQQLDLGLEKFHASQQEVPFVNTAMVCECGHCKLHGLEDGARHVLSSVERVLVHPGAARIVYHEPSPENASIGGQARGQRLEDNADIHGSLRWRDSEEDDALV